MPKIIDSEKTKIGQTLYYCGKKHVDLIYMLLRPPGLPGKTYRALYILYWSFAGEGGKDLWF